MSHGLRVTNLSNEIQIDNNLRVYQSVESFTYSSGTKVSQINQNCNYIRPTSSGTIYVVEAPPCSQTVDPTIYSTSGSFEVTTVKPSNELLGGNDVGYGLVVYDDIGRRIFSSNIKTAHQITRQQYSGPSRVGTSNMNRSISLPPIPAGRKRYINLNFIRSPVCGEGLVTCSPFLPEFGILRSFSVTFNNNGASMSTSNVESRSVPGTLSNFTWYQYLIVLEI